METQGVPGTVGVDLYLLPVMLKGFSPQNKVWAPTETSKDFREGSEVLALLDAESVWSVKWQTTACEP